MKDVARDRRIGLALKAGSIAFRRSGSRIHAVSLVDIIVEDEAGGGSTRVQVEMKVPADPRTDTIHDLTERYRTGIVSVLREAADIFDRETADALLFDESDTIG